MWIFIRDEGESNGKVAKRIFHYRAEDSYIGLTPCGSCRRAISMEEEIKKTKTLKVAASAGLFLLEIIKLAILAGLMILFIRHFLFKPFYVNGASMEPNFEDKDYLIIDELSYRFREPRRGEVVVFRYPDDEKEYFIKRIIGLPGERVKVSEGRVTIYNLEYPEGMVIQEDYLPDGLLTQGNRTIYLGDDEYFVLGDNRNNSYDSRKFGAIDKDVIVGRTVFLGWPIDRLQVIKSPEFDF